MCPTHVVFKRLTQVYNSTGHLAKVNILKGVLAVMMVQHGFVTLLENIEMLDILRSHRPKVAEYVRRLFFCNWLIQCRRILRISNHEDVRKITSPPDGIVNIVIANPTKLQLINNYICSKAHNVFIVASLTAVTTYFCNHPNGIRGVCVKPFFHSWPRFVAIIGSVLGSSTLHFRSWHGGIVFGVATTSSHGPRIYQYKGKYSAPINGAMIPVHEPSKHSIFYHCFGNLCCNSSTGL